jgi:hypothetical protein
MIGVISLHPNRVDYYGIPCTFNKYLSAGEKLDSGYLEKGQGV